MRCYRLVLGDGVDERVAGLGVLDEQAAHAHRQRAEVPACSAAS